MSEGTLSPTQVVAVAKDVLKQIAGREITVATNFFIETETDEPTVAKMATILDDDQRDDGFGTVELQKLLKRKVFKKCQVCARGAMVLAKARLYDDCPITVSSQGDLYNIAGTVIQGSIDFFGQMAKEIEACFEGYTNPQERARAVALSYMANWQPATCPPVSLYRIWKDIYPDPTRRLKELMRNLIRNKGEFVLTDYVGPEPVPVPSHKKPTVKQLVKASKKAPKKVVKK